MPPEQAIGRVLLVGAGPGAADLLTVRALRAIESAQALLYDSLVSDEVLALAPTGCACINTGKRCGRASMSQALINRLMLRLGQRGLRVVRLKGGDPSIFGRVGEERMFLQSRGVPVEVIPGVTAACTAAAQFGFPLTHRGEARRVVFTTARVESGALTADWQGMSDTQTTLAIYMAAAAARAVRDQLISMGRSPSTPALAVESAGSPSARMVRGTLSELTEISMAVGGGPVLLVVGDVAAYASAQSVEQVDDQPLVLRA